jgi:hypothetical protein
MMTGPSDLEERYARGPALQALMEKAKSFASSFSGLKEGRENDQGCYLGWH